MGLAILTKRSKHGFPDGIKRHQDGADEEQRLLQRRLLINLGSHFIQRRVKMIFLELKKGRRGVCLPWFLFFKIPVLIVSISLSSKNEKTKYIIVNQVDTLFTTGGLAEPCNVKRG